MPLKLRDAAAGAASGLQPSSPVDNKNKNINKSSLSHIKSLSPSNNRVHTCSMFVKGRNSLLFILLAVCVTVAWRVQRPTISHSTTITATTIAATTLLAANNTATASLTVVTTAMTDTMDPTHSPRAKYHPVGGLTIETPATTATATATTTALSKKLPYIFQPPEPSFQDRIQIGQRFAYKVSNFKFDQQAQKIMQQQHLTLTRLGDSEWLVHEATLQASVNRGDCLVYSFGVAQYDVFTEIMAQKGCHVIAMDPTVQHKRQWMPNVTFYPWGLTNRATSSTSSIITSTSGDDNPPHNNNNNTNQWSHPIYGNITGQFLTLPEIIQRLGHDDGRTITAMKLDCEGCEFAAFQDLVQGHVTNPILMLHVEFHFASTLGMVDDKDVARMYYAHIYLKTRKCLLARQRRHAGFEYDRNQVPKLLQRVGVSAHHCCYEMMYLCGRQWGYGGGGGSGSGGGAA